MAKPYEFEAALKDARILIADDEVIIALDMEDAFRTAGAEIVGPCSTLAETMRAARDGDVSAAVLDIRLGRETTETVALYLASRQIPFVFYTGQMPPESLRHDMPHTKSFMKPVSSRTIVEAVAKLPNEAANDLPA